METNEDESAQTAKQKAGPPIIQQRRTVPPRTTHKAPTKLEGSRLPHFRRFSKCHPAGLRSFAPNTTECRGQAASITAWFNPEIHSGQTNPKRKRWQPAPSLALRVRVIARSGPRGVTQNGSRLHHAWITAELRQNNTGTEARDCCLSGGSVPAFLPSFFTLRDGQSHDCDRQFAVMRQAGGQT